MSTEDDYIGKLKSHDWYYQYSDDGRVHRRGSAERSALNVMQKALDPNHEIWNQHAPEDCKVISGQARDMGKQLLEALSPETTPLDKELVDSLIDGGAYLNTGYGRMTPLLCAITRGETDIAIKLIAKGASVQLGDSARATPSHYTALYNNTAVLNLLIAKGAQLNSTNDLGNTALAIAAAKGHKVIAAMLLSAGADKKRKNNEKKSPLEIAQESGSQDIEKMITADDDALMQAIEDAGALTPALEEARAIQQGLPTAQDIKGLPPVKFKNPGVKP